MRKIIILVLLILIFPNYSFAFDDGDFQYWNSEAVSVKIDKDWKIKVEEGFRFGNNASDFYYQYSDAGLTYSGFNKWFDLGTNYRLVFEEKKDNWQYENRPYLNATFKFDAERFKFSDRSRFEYRDKEKGNDSWRYRNKLIIKFPLKLTQFEIQPYIADEIFVDFDKKDLNKNRLYLGFEMGFLKNLKGEIFYLWQSTKGSKWKDYNVLGTSLKLVF